jgi:VanZ family protein
VPAEHVPALRVFQWDKLLHVVSFGGLTVLWRYASVSPRVTVLLMGLLALGTELAQRWMRVGRQWDVRDLAADGIGIALGLLVAWGTFRVFGARTEAASISEG